MELNDNGKLCFLHLLTHPHMTSLGGMRATTAGLASELHWELQVYEGAFGELLSKGMVKYDPRACFICLPNFLKYNQPESPNVVRSWQKFFDDLPECLLKTGLIVQTNRILKDLSKGFQDAFQETFGGALPKTLLNQEQEQEPEQEFPSPCVDEKIWESGNELDQIGMVE